LRFQDSCWPGSRSTVQMPRSSVIGERVQLVAPMTTQTPWTPSPLRRSTTRPLRRIMPDARTGGAVRVAPPEPTVPVPGLPTPLGELGLPAERAAQPRDAQCVAEAHDGATGEPRIAAVEHDTRKAEALRRPGAVADVPAAARVAERTDAQGETISRRGRHQAS